MLDGLVRALRADGRFDVVGQATDGAAAVALVEQLHPDLALLDVRMPILDGIRALAPIAERAPSTRVVLLSAFDDDVVTESALASGAAGYLLKDTDRGAICDALARAGAGEVLRRPSDMDHQHPCAPAPPDLTPRERDALRLAHGGWNQATIALHLDIEPEDVDSYLNRVAAKLGADDRAGAIEAARAWGLIP